MWRRRCACYAVGVVRGNAIDAAAEDAAAGSGIGINPWSVLIGGVVVDDLPGPGDAVLALDGVLDCAGGAAPGKRRLSL